MTDGHKVEGCAGRWIDIGTLSNPFLQKCSSCRGTRQKPAEDGEIVDVKALSAAEERHMRGLERLKADLERDALEDPVHQDDEGFWFWTDVEAGHRYGPYETRDHAELAFREWLDMMIEEGDKNRGMRWLWLAVIVTAVVVAIVLRSLVVD